MNFGDKIKNLRIEKNMKQKDLAEILGVSTRTIISYENGKSYPKKRELYAIIADYFNVDVNYLLTENESFIAKADMVYGYSGKKQAMELVAQAQGLFAGGELDEEDKDAVMRALQEAYWDAKKDAARKE